MASSDPATPRRFGQVQRLRPGAAARYIELHADPWPGVDAAIKQASITSYSIFEFDDLLFAYLEYCGDGFEGDMSRMADDPVVQEWWTLNDPLLERLDGTTGTQLWENMREIYRLA